VRRAAQEWERRVRPHFDFLVERGFGFDHVEDHWWATSAFYLSPSLGIEVTRSVEFDRVEVTLLRHVDGRLPEPEIWVTDRPLNRVLFDNVLIARAPELAEDLPAGLSDEAVEKQLGLWAKLVRTVAADFLDGDGAAIAEAEQVIRRRVADDPQELTIWLPSDASQADERRAREEAERTTPPDVRVVVRRYAR
jgi:hypothetical protein